MMERKILPVGPIDANCVILWTRPAASDAAAECPCWIVDPGADAEDIVAFCAARRLRPALIALTHGHFDHIGAIPGLLARWPDLPVHLASADAALAFSRANAWPPHYAPVTRPATLVEDLAEGATLSAAGLSARVLATPGHTPGSVCFLFAPEAAGAAPLLLSGDTLFAGSCGRTDFPGGSMAEMTASLARLAELAPETEVVPGHGLSTTIAREVASNPFMNG